MSEDLHPQQGARYLFERDEHDGSTARYRAAIFTPDAAYWFTARLGADGSHELEPEVDGGAPAELVTRLAGLARQLARGAGTKAKEGLPPWPARVLRWRR